MLENLLRKNGIKYPQEDFSLGINNYNSNKSKSDKVYIPYQLEKNELGIDT